MKTQYIQRLKFFVISIVVISSLSVNAQFTNWSYFKDITIDNTGNSSNLNDYSVLVIVNTSELIAGGKMNPDGSDIRFTTNFSDNLSYWIDSGIQNEYAINTAATHIWVKVPAINASGTSIIKLVYGNPAASSESNISTTFLLGDDFNDNVLDASKWYTIKNYSGVLNEQNQRIEHNSPATNPESDSYIYSNLQFTEPVVLEMQFKKGGYVYRTAGLHESYQSWYNSATFGWQDYGEISVNTTVNNVPTSIAYGDTYWSTTYNPEYYLKIIRKEDGNFSYSMSVPAIEPGGPVDWNQDIAASMPLSTPLMVVARDYVWYASSDLQLRYEDNIRVRKYSNPEPSATLSAEQPLVTYCIPQASLYPCTYMWITNVNTSGGIDELNNNSDCSGISYTDYSSSFSASNKQGAYTSFSFTSSGYALSYSVWIDFNSDNLFTGEEQVISEANSSGLFTISAGFTVPATAALGLHRMRIRGEYNSVGVPTDPCSQLQYGETEDYGFTILPSTGPSTVNLTFNVDMSQPINEGFFITGTDALYVTGNFANANGTGWDVPGTGESFVLTDDNSDYIYTGTVAVDTSFGELIYKYFKNATWDYGDNVTGDRTIYIGKTDYVIDPPDIWYMTSPNTPLPIDFETGPYTFIDFAGGITNVIANPQFNGINTSANVAQQIRYPDQVYAGSKLPLNGFLDFSTDPIITMKVFSNKKGVPVVLKAENNDNSQSSGDVYAYTTKSGEWEILVFNFNGSPSGVFNNLTFIFDIGSLGDGTANSTFLFDDLKFGATDLFAGGLGTMANPYQIANAEQLNNVRKFLGPQYTDVYFSQISSIDLGIYPWNYNEGWEPIGNTINQFHGNFNGNLNSIYGLTINRPDSNYVGLFGRVMEGALTNIDLVNVSISGNRHVGSVAGQVRNNSYISNCRATGNLMGQVFAGGMVASLYIGSTLENCYSMVTVQMTLGSNGNEQLGGLVGRLHDNSSIFNSFATGNVEGLGTGAWIGGLVGATSENSSISNSYATGEVNGGSYVGGLVGASEYSNISNCYSVGKVASIGGGLVSSQTGSTITNCYWNIETSAQSTSAGGEPKTTFQLIYSSTFNSWPFGSTWSITEGGTYPYLVWQGSPNAYNYPILYIPPSNLTAVPHNGSISLSWQAPSMGGVNSYYIYRDGSYYTQTTSLSYEDYVSNYTTYKYYVTAYYGGYESNSSNVVSTFANPGFMAGGDGSASNPFLVSNSSELHTVRLYLNAHFKQINDIEVYPWNTGNGWIPIGTFDKPFTGSYNGNDFSINYLVINRPDENAVGLFGSINGAIIENINFFSASITGNSYVGVLAGDVNYSSLSNISVQGDVYGVRYVGGISGGNFQNSTINKSHSIGSINASGNWIGGLSGLNYNGCSINNSYSTMNIYTSGYSVGGISGTNEQVSTISNCYALGSVQGSAFVGGISGWVDSSNVVNCYSIGYITGNNNTGGLVGALESNGKVTNSYWNTETSGQSTSAGGEGRTYDEMTYTYASNTYLGWDFTYIWGPDDTYTFNNGYPYLRMLDATTPSVITYEPESMTSNSAVVKGNVTSDGGFSVTARGMVWSASPNPTIESNNGMTLDGQGLGPFTSTLTNLNPSFKYYVKAYATNILGTSYGTEFNFNTLSGSGTITINGKTQVCEGEKGVTYSIGTDSYTNINWNVTNGDIVSGIGTNTIIVDWNNFGSSGIVAVQAVNSNLITVNNSKDVFFTGSSSYPNPTIHVKGPGKANILICETPNVQYQWYKNNQLMSGETKQFYVAKTNVGQYYVAINDNSGCLAYSETETITNKKTVNLYPNPATQSTTLSYEAEITGQATIKIRDVFGKTLKQWDWEKPNYQLQEDIPLHELKKGVYMVEISVDGISQVIEQLIIN